ncbi:MAG: S8 family serine peptidase [Candidatus Sericytochromatia bacterium]
MKKTFASLIISSLVISACSTEETIITAPAPKTEIKQETKQNVQINNEISKSVQNNIIDQIKPTKEELAPNAPSSIKVIERVNIAENYNTQTLLAGIRNEKDYDKVRELATKYNVKIENFMQGINTVVLATNNQNVPELIKKLSAEKVFSFIETDNMATNKPTAESDIVDSIFSIFSTPQVNDKYFKDQYGLINTNVDKAWELSTGKNVKVAVIDSGVDVKHDDLKVNVLPGYDAFSKIEGEKAANASKLNYISSTYKHGSHVAGIIAAQYNNTKGIAGVAPEAKILPVKIFPDFTDFFKAAKKNDDGSDVTVVSAIADGIVWSVKHNADVINLSLGLWEQSNTIERAVKYALENNVSVVVAAGNERATTNRKNYLAAINGVIAVGATDKNNQIAFFSNSGDYVSVAAPGFDIVSTTPSFLNLKNYRKMSGTSMASPLVAGIAAMLKDKFKDKATPAWIKERIEKTATDLGAQGRDDLYGSGLVNAYKALNDPI